jgi:hypothetical protein
MIPHQTSLRLLVVTGCLLLGSAASAQMDPGFLGKRYAGAGLFIETVKEGNLDAGTAALAVVNQPLGANLDLNGYASYERFSDYSIRDKRIGANLVGYRELEYFKPFVELGVAGTWQSSEFNGRKYENHDGIYIGGLGVEAAVGRQTAVFLKANFNKYFDSDNGDYWTYTLGLNTWFNDKIGGSASIAFNESETTVYTFAAVYRF